MMDKKKKSKIVGVAGTVWVHVALFLFLFLFYVRMPQPQEEGGVPVMLGNTDMAQGTFDPGTMTEVDILPDNAADVSEPETAEPEPPVITQPDEPTVAMPSEKKNVKKPESKKTETKKTEKKVTKPVKPKEKTAEEKQQEAEKAAAREAQKQIAGAFGKGAQIGSSGDAAKGEGTQGSTAGNANRGKTDGIGGYGIFDLDGRSTGEGGLPQPVYNVQDEGKVVVSITVNPSGRVIAASVSLRGTTTVNLALRKAAEEAARKARFNRIEGTNNQIGMITYYFKRK